MSANTKRKTISQFCARSFVNRNSLARRSWAYASRDKLNDYSPGGSVEILATLYLAYLGFIGGLSSILLWPAVALTF